MEKAIERFIVKQGALIASIFIIIGFFIIIISLFVKPFNDGSFNPDPTMFGQYGDFVGGFIGTLFTLAGFVLIFKTFIAQRDTIELQKRTSLLERNDNLFFNLLNSQQNITDKIKAYFYTLHNLTEEVTKTIEGRDFFSYSKGELIKIWVSLNSEKHYHYDTENVQFAQNQIDELYSSLAYFDPEDLNHQEHIIRDNINLSFTNKVYGITNLLWKNIKDKPTNEKIKSMYAFYFTKFHYVAGHYFRHLYHILSFIEDVENSLTKTAKNEHEKDEIIVMTKRSIAFLQSQMSSFELMLLFYNSLSFPKAMELVKKYNVLENLAIEDLIDKSHNCIEGINLKNRRSLLGLD